MNFGHFEGRGLAVKTDEERSSVAICYEKCMVGLAVTIEIVGDDEVPYPLVLTAVLSATLFENSGQFWARASSL